MKTIWVCNYCGSENVYLDAWADANNPTEVVATFDQAFCADCDGETTLIEKSDFEVENQ